MTRRRIAQHEKSSSFGEKEEEVELVPILEKHQHELQEHGQQHQGVTSSMCYYRSLAFFALSIALVNIIRLGISTLDIGKRSASHHNPSSINMLDADIWHVEPATTPYPEQDDNKTTSGSNSGELLPTTTQVKPDALLGLGGLLPATAQTQVTTTIIKQKSVLVIGGAGFIGFHVSMYFKKIGHVVVILDSMQSNYYSRELQQVRSSILSNEGIPIYNTSICEVSSSRDLLEKHHITHVIYLAAQPYSLDISSSYSIKNATTKLFEYPPNNIDCFATLLDLLKDRDVHLIYAINQHWHELHGAHPQIDLFPSYYSQQQQLLANAYYKLYGLASIGIQFPTTYGPYGRPYHYYYNLVATALSSTINASEPATISLPIILSSNNTLQISKKTLHTSLIFVDDVVRGIASATDFVFDGSQVLTLGKTCSFSWRKVGIPAIIAAAEKNNNNNNNNESFVPPIIQEIDVSSMKEIHFSPNLFQIDNATSFDKKYCHDNINDQVPLSTGMQAFVNWYQIEQGDRFIADHGLSSNKSATLLLSSISDDDDESISIKDKIPHHICFVTSFFTENGNAAKKANILASTSHLDHSLPYQFFAFTNTEEAESNDGWERIVLRNLPFRRFVTGTRWPKYMGWKHEKLSTCKIIFYSDSSLRPKDLPLWEWMDLAQIAEKDGIIHQLHSTSQSTILKELGSGFPKAKEWFLQQADFDNTAPRYKSNAFVYDPSNRNVRELMTMFWAHYSQEADAATWRDQPLYRYLLSKLKIHPGHFPSKNDKEKEGEIKDYWEESWEEDIHF